MYSKKYMYDAGQITCMKLIEDGYLHTFVEILNLMNINKKVRKEAEHVLDKIMPRDFTSEPENLHFIQENLKTAEDSIRKGSVMDGYSTRMKLGKYFHELEGYSWLAEYFYKSCQKYSSDTSIHVKLIISSLQQQALLEESRGNEDLSLMYLEKAQRTARKHSLDETDPIVKLLNEYVCRIYQQLGTKRLEQEADGTPAENSIALKYFRKAVKVSKTSDDIESQAACRALLGKGLMQFNNDEAALKNFELYAELSEKCNDKYGMCQGLFAISESFKRMGDLEKSISALHKCQDLAKEQSFDIPLVISAISLGQIQTAKRQYYKAFEYFEEAYSAAVSLDEDNIKAKSLKNLTRVMYGIGKAHLTFKPLITILQNSTHFSLLKLISWRHIGGPFTEEITEMHENFINLEEAEKDEASEISLIIDKLVSREFNQE